MELLVMFGWGKVEVEEQEGQGLSAAVVPHWHKDSLMAPGQ